MREYSERDAAVARAVSDRNRTINRRRRERQRALRRRKRIHMLAIGVIVVMGVFIAVTTVSYSVQMTELKGQVEQKQAELAQLNSEYVSLNAKKENSVDLDQVENYAKNVLGLVKMDRSQEEYLELQKTDQVEVNEASSGVDKLVSSFVKSFNAILSFLR